MRRPNLILSARGFSIAEVLIATIMVSALGLGTVEIAQLQATSGKNQRAARVAQMGQHEIQAALQNPAAWSQSIANNASLQCGSTAAGCALGPETDGFHRLVVYSSNALEKITYDTTDATTRLAINGGRCPAGTSDPSEECPFTYTAHWKPVCQSYAAGDCRFPTIVIKVDLSVYFPLQKVTINPTRYEISLVRPYLDDTIANACTSIGGKFNPSTGLCVPWYAGKTCASVGKTYQAVSMVNSDGSIDCKPVYTGQCGVGEVMSGITTAGNPICVPLVPPGTCPTSCVGNWSSCSVACGGVGSQTFSITTPAANGGAACGAADGATQSCDNGACPVNCVGAFGPCSVSCGGPGQQFYSISTAAQNGGTSCPFANGDMQLCNSAPCGNIDCGGTWGACNPVTAMETFNITQMPQGSGAACPAPRPCKVDCVGNWSACSGSPESQTYTITQNASTWPAPNNGAACQYADGQNSTAGCTADWGLCGSSHGNGQPAMPTTNLCAQGTPTAVTWAEFGGTQRGKWQWSCQGLYGGQSCFAPSWYGWYYTCFVAGTQVTLASGQTKDIEKVEIGEIIRTYDELTKQQVNRPVEKVFHHEKKRTDLYTFYFGGKQVTSNDQHRFFLPRSETYQSAAAI